MSPIPLVPALRDSIGISHQQATKPWLRTCKVAKMIGCSSEHVRTLINKGILPAWIKENPSGRRTILVHKSDLTHFLLEYARNDNSLDLIFYATQILERLPEAQRKRVFKQFFALTE